MESRPTINASGGHDQRPERPPRPSGRPDVVGAGLWVLGAYLVGLSLVMIIAPGLFFDQIAPIGVRNDHYILDGATFQLALGAGALVAARRRDWRISVLAIVTFQFALHALNHLKDVNDARPQWLGVANFVALAAGVLLLIWLLRYALSEKRMAP